MSTPATATIESLESARNEARAAATHPRVTRLRSVLNSPAASTPQKREAQAELIALRSERKALLEQGGQQLVAAQAQLSAARRADRDAAVEAIAVEFRGLGLERLEHIRASIERDRRVAKQRHRAVVKVLGELEAERRIADLIATMNDADKRALLQQLQVSSTESAEKVGTPGAS